MHLVSAIDKRINLLASRKIKKKKQSTSQYRVPSEIDIITSRYITSRLS